MRKSHVAAKQPAEVALEAGKTYAWCACGLSENNHIVMARTARRI